MRIRMLEFTMINHILIIFLLMQLVVGCNSGGVTSATNSSINNNQLAAYKEMLTYVSASSSSDIVLRAAGATKQQAFVAPAGGLILNSIKITLFGTTNCSFNSTLTAVTLNGNSGVTFPTGTYTSSNASNLALYNRFKSILAAPQNVQSIRFDYYYNPANGGPGFVSADCMQNTGIGNYESSQEACTSGSACGFNQASTQVTSLPSLFIPAIFVTASQYNGNLGGFGGANQKCMSDLNVPARGAGSQWRALLNNNFSTAPGKEYYRSNDYSTLIGVANSPSLTGWGVNSGLTNSISTTGLQVWTGFTPNMDFDYTDWIVDKNGADFNACSNWTSNSSFEILGHAGVYGQADARNGQSDNDNPGMNQGWAVLEFGSCDSFRFLYCVQQDN